MLPEIRMLFIDSSYDQSGSFIGKYFLECFDSFFSCHWIEQLISAFYPLRHSNVFPPAPVHGDNLCPDLSLVHCQRIHIGISSCIITLPRAS